ncbi:uncharacterized protein LOC112565650 isoform X2 [Pomacea canaliculata]|uniref:uncharacterized protein LOC112565650 isoform X2 n=1 Tax=Pomacea canaliculata TaxID=400727 RepID=UPI000D737D89|nr:uncharacterized protein LOC112565650 isoform X2 [Pomacea canaliculata]
MTLSRKTNIIIWLQGSMSMPNQGARQLFLYDHGRPHWSQGGPLFYPDRRMPPPPPGPHGPSAPHPHPMSNHFQNQPFPGQGPGAGPAPQWVRGPLMGGPPPGPGPHPHPGGPPNHQQQLDGFGFNLPWNMANNNHHYHRHNNRNFNHRDNNHRNHNGRVGGNGGGGQVSNRNENGEQRYLCCKCGDYLQNSNESGVHLCDANVPNNQQQPSASRERELSSEEIQSRLAMLLETVKASCSEITDNPPLSEAVQRYFAARIEELASLETAIMSETSNSEERLAELKVRLCAVEERDSLLREQEQQLAKERIKFEEECKKEREELARQWQQLRDEITRMEEMNRIQKGRIKLDVGGHVFTTSQLTLTRDSDSMLAAMFSGRHGVKKEEDGTIFIDRDGTHFRYILNYLRDGGLSTDALPRNRQTLRELRNEAVYFQLHGLVQHIEKFL